MKCIADMRYTDWLFILETSNLWVRPEKNLMDQVPYVRDYLEQSPQEEVIEEKRVFMSCLLWEMK